MRYASLFVIFALLLSVTVGCSGVDPQKEIALIKKEKDQIHNNYISLLQRQKQMLTHLKKQNDDLKQRRPYDAEKKVLARELEGIAGLMERDGELVVLMTADILFDPGRSAIKNSAKSVLARLANALNDDLFANKAIRVEGHTDSDPIKRSKKHFKDNWDLGAARANSVLQYLIKDGKMDPTARTMYAASFSKYHPVSQNSDKAAKAQNRRVEVVVVMGQ